MSTSVRSPPLSRSCEDGDDIRVPLERLDADGVDLRTHLSSTVVHLDGIGTPQYYTALDKALRDASHHPSADLDGSAAPLWCVRVAGVVLAVSAVLPEDETERKLLRRLAASVRLRILPGQNVVQKVGSPACAWSNRDWCISCGSTWHPLALCPLIVRLVRHMLDEGKEVSFDKGLCMRCGYLGHTAGYCRTSLDRSYLRLWHAYQARVRRWSCLEFVFPDVPVGPLAPRLLEEKCYRDMPPNPMSKNAPPLPLCVRCSRPTGEARALLEEVLERQRHVDLSHREDDQAKPPECPAETVGVTETGLPDDLVLPEPATLAVRDPVRTLSCVSAWQNWFGYGAQQLSQLGHTLTWRVQRMPSIPFGGFVEYGMRLPSRLALTAAPQGSPPSESRKRPAQDALGDASSSRPIRRVFHSDTEIPPSARPFPRRRPGPFLRDRKGSR